jgi:16S rRNA G966 N2-methylase RsmD
MTHTGKRTSFASTTARLFPFEPGVDRDLLQFSDEASYSITRPAKAKLILRIIGMYLHRQHKRASDCTITDGTACVGGDTLHFSKVFKHVHAVEVNPTHCRMLKTNLRVYGRTNVSVCCGDYLTRLPQLKQDVVFLDPPWGGRSYKKHERVSLSLSTVPIHEVVDRLFRTVSLIVLKTPTNFDVGSLFASASDTDTPSSTATATARDTTTKEVHVHHLGNMLIIVIANSAAATTATVEWQRRRLRLSKRTTRPRGR